MPTSLDRIDRFNLWLNLQLENRGITDVELSRRAGISHSVISRARHGSLPGWEACKAIARGLNLPAEVVFRAAGHLPSHSSDDPLKKEIDHLYTLASPEQRQDLLNYLRYLIERKK